MCKPTVSEQHNGSALDLKLRPQKETPQKTKKYENKTRIQPMERGGASDWSDEGAPVPAQPYTHMQLAWFPVLAAIALRSIRALNEHHAATSIAWILYESYIVFDHVPFLCTNELYESPKFNYTYLSVFFFWGMEAVASIVSTQSAVGAPPILLYNVAPHFFFVFANYVRGAATSQAFVGEKKWWVFLQVSADTTIHGVSLWYHLLHFFSGLRFGSLNLSMALMVPATWIGLLGSMVLLTCLVHRSAMKWEHFVRAFASVYQAAVKASW